MVQKFCEIVVAHQLCRAAVRVELGHWNVRACWPSSLYALTSACRLKIQTHNDTFGL
jgi:hypothetical protein